MQGVRDSSLSTRRSSCGCSGHLDAVRTRVMMTLLVDCYQEVYIIPLAPAGSLLASHGPGSLLQRNSGKRGSAATRTSHSATPRVPQLQPLMPHHWPPRSQHLSQGCIRHQALEPMTNKTVRKDSHRNRPPQQAGTQPGGERWKGQYGGSLEGSMRSP